MEWLTFKLLNCWRWKVECFASSPRLYDSPLLLEGGVGGVANAIRIFVFIKHN